ncbi:hypothetical protein FKG94_23100 [Exilibacterium tricleocarpae]|uniref:Uncharacterized protein n=1 Tax=Exilibacterium tricleocarpae TaxID=2591008 RepID=A0A545SXJ3_9GAMM|nr:hypothetical protein [Exilibacterium tricleocarpae]TQV69683.1 hypothetical protein FKG94_23100 [Exilibacterium tricleocarpae]
MITFFVRTQVETVEACAQRLQRDRCNLSLATSRCKAHLIKKIGEGPTIAGFFIAGGVLQSLQSKNLRMTPLSSLGLVKYVLALVYPATGGQ